MKCSSRTSEQKDLIVDLHGRARSVHFVRTPTYHQADISIASAWCDRHAAIRCKDRTGYEAGVLGSQESDCCGDFVWRTHAVHRLALGHRRHTLVAPSVVSG